MISAAGKDPFFIPDVSQIYPAANGSWANNGPYKATTGRTVRNITLDTGIKNLILILAGQSNRESEAPSAYSLTNSSAIDNFNIYDGAPYAWQDPPLGCSYQYQVSGLGPGHLGGRIADKFITGTQFNRVIGVPVAIGGAQISAYTSGGLVDLLPMTMRRLSARGFTAQNNVTVAIEWGHGETDGPAGTTQLAYTTGLNTVISNVRNAGFSGRFFVATQSWAGGTTYSAITNAQAAVVDGLTVFASGNLDTLNNSNRADTTHLNDAGIASAATLIYNAMHASGAPF